MSSIIINTFKSYFHEVFTYLKKHIYFLFVKFIKFIIRNWTLNHLAKSFSQLQSLNENPFQGNMHIWVLPKSGDWGKLGIPNLEDLFSMLRNFTGFTIIKRKPTEGVKIRT